MDESSIIRDGEWRNARHGGSEGCGWRREKGRTRGRIKGESTGSVTGHKPRLHTITVTNHIVFVATAQRNTS